MGWRGGRDTLEPGAGSIHAHGKAGQSMLESIEELDSGHVLLVIGITVLEDAGIIVCWHILQV